MKRLGHVDGLRAVAALTVVLCHVALTVERGATWPGPIGHTAVSVFIVLSGYSLMLPVVRHDCQIPDGAWGFYRRRARRILPPYYAALALALLLIWLAIGQRTGAVWDESLPVTWQSVVAHLLLFQDFATAKGSQIDYVFWSIALECQIYLLFPALVWFWRRYRQPLFCALIVLALSLTLTNALALTWIGQHVANYALYAFAPQYVGLFALGMCAASLTPQRRYVWEALALMCWLFVAWSVTRVALPLVDVATGVGTMSLLLAATRPGVIQWALSWRPLVWIGGFSYSLYLIHAPLLQLVWQYLIHPLRLGDMATYAALLVVGLPLILAAAWGFWYVAERPFMSQGAGAAIEGWRRISKQRALNKPYRSTRPDASAPLRLPS